MNTNDCTSMDTVDTVSDTSSAVVSSAVVGSLPPLPPPIVLDFPSVSAEPVVVLPSAVTSSAVPSVSPSVVVSDDEKLRNYTKKERHDLFFMLLTQMLDEVYDVYPDLPGILKYKVFLNEKKLLKSKKKSAVRLFESFFKENKGLISTRDISRFRNKEVRYSNDCFINFDAILKDQPFPENPIYDYLVNMEHILDLSDNTPQTLRLMSKLREDTPSVDLNELPQVIGNIVNEFKEMKELNIANVINKLTTSKNTKKLFDTMKAFTAGMSGDDTDSKTNDNKSSFDMNALLGSLGGIMSSIQNKPS